MCKRIYTHAENVLEADGLVDNPLAVVRDQVIESVSQNVVVYEYTASDLFVLNKVEKQELNLHYLTFLVYLQQ